MLVGEGQDEADGPYYVRNPFESEPGWGVSSINFDINTFHERGAKE